MGYLPAYLPAILQLEWVDNRLKADFGCRQGGAAVPAAPTMPTEQTIGDNLPTEFTEPTEFSGGKYSPTDFTDVHRLGGYGILPYPRSHQTIFPQKFLEEKCLPQIAQNSQICLAENILPRISQILTDV